MTPYPLGRREFHDSRSKAFRATVPGEVKTTRHRIPPLMRRLDQGQLGSCEGNGTVHCLGTQPLKKRFTRYRTEADAVKVYSLATTLDGFPGDYPPEDNGTSNVAVAKAAKSLGWISEYRWHFGLQDTLAGLTESPLLAGVPWYEGMFEPDSKGYLNPTGREVGGHAFCLFGVNVKDRSVDMLNSWQDWGYGQTARITFDALGFLLDNGGEITQLVV
jgi:hypothetical protein